MSAAHVHDVLIVGAGPGGSAAAAFLADQGFDVLVLERSEFPRFHIGESLLPLGVGVLERLGIEPDPDVFKFKRGAQFICETTHRSFDISFSEAFPGPPRHAYQVERPAFDAIVRDRARAAGAQVRHGVYVRDVDIDETGVTLGLDSGESLRGRYLVDASGQGRLMGRLKKALEPYKDFGIAAAYQHFEGIDESKMGEHGDIRIMMRPEGWGWVIPLPHGRLSVGAVTANKGSTADTIVQYIANSPLISDWVAGSKASEPALIGNYSFHNEAAHGARYVCVGDAASFLDPVFSSGVSLALTGAERATALLGPALREGREGAPELMAGHTESMQGAYDAFAALIRRFYHTNMVSNLFFGAPEGADLRQGIVSVLAGDVFRDDNPFQQMLGRSRRVRSRASA